MRRPSPRSGLTTALVRAAVEKLAGGAAAELLAAGRAETVR
ncbi:hypothetical protein ACWED2_45025 [Amycolatopsis sp. NPDC005003]